MSESKVLLIGLDGGTFDILEPFAREGLIPNLARLMAQGAKGVLRSTTPPISAPAWATFQTGKNPGKHGLFNFFDLSESGYRSSHDFRTSKVVNHASIQSATVYDYLREGGKQVISVNIPLTFPTPEVNGNLISCWLTPPGSREFTFPRSLADELPEYRIDQNFGEGMYALTPTGKELDSDYLFDDLMDILGRRADAMEYLLTHKEWDAAMICFTETDRVHHYFWRAINPDYPGYESDKVAHERDRFRAFYRELDVRIGRLMDAAGEGVNTIVMSDHGFDAPPTRRYHMSHWMMEQGWLKTTAGEAPSDADAEGDQNPDAEAPAAVAQGPLLKAGKSLWKRLVPPSLRDQVYARLGYQPKPQVADWAQTKAWSFGVNNNLGAICINERDGSGNGCIAAGPELARLTDEIEAGLAALTDPATGKPVIKEVIRREAIYDGPHVGRFPHLLFLLDPDFEADYESGFGITHDRIQSEGVYPDGRGNHRPEGIFLATGPDIATGDKREYDLQCVMPMLLHLCGLPVPEDVDGEVMADYLNEAGASRLTGRSEPVEHRFSEPSDEDVEALQKKLQELGYM